MADKGPPLGLGQIIRRQRELSEVSMRKVASLAGISNPYLSQIERGLREPSERVVGAIATALNEPQSIEERIQNPHPRRVRRRRFYMLRA